VDAVRSAQAGGDGPDGRRELQRARLANLHLRARITSLEEFLRELGQVRKALDAELERARTELAATRVELSVERSERAEAEAKVARMQGELRRVGADLASAGWRVERERRARAEAELADLRLLREQHRRLLAEQLGHLEELVAGWKDEAEEPAVAAVEPEAPGRERGRTRRRLRHLRQSAGASASFAATPAGLLLARALELATGEIDSKEATQELMAMAKGDAVLLEEAIARAERVLRDSPALGEAGAVEPESASEVFSQLPVVMAGASTLLSAALHRSRAR
jgi:hypothetical protein